MTSTYSQFIWVVSGALMFIGAWCVLGNLWIVAQWVCFKKRASFIPLIGGLALGLGVLLMPALPWRHRWPLAIAAVVVDISIAELPLVFICWATPPLRRRTLDRRPEEGAQGAKRTE